MVEAFGEDAAFDFEDGNDLVKLGDGEVGEFHQSFPVGFAGLDGLENNGFFPGVAEN